MANEHYKKAGVETRELIDLVQSYCPWMTPSEVIDSFNIIKYAQRAGVKEGENWEKDARKIADYITHFKYGKYIDQRYDEPAWKVGTASFDDFEKFMRIVRRDGLGVSFRLENGEVVVGATCRNGCCFMPMDRLIEDEDDSFYEDYEF